MTYANSTSRVIANLNTDSTNEADAGTIDTAPGIENVIGSPTAGVDHFTGDTGPNRIEGLAGGDTFLAGDGADTLIGGADDDLINAGNGDDLLEGNGGTDQLNGEADDDTVTFVNAAAGVTADLEANSISVDGDGAFDFNSGLDHIVGSPFDDNLSGRNGQPNTINGGAGADTIRGRSEGDTLDGDGGTDTASFQFAPAAVTANLASGQVTGGASGTDSITDFENLFGANIHDDILIGNGNANQLNGLSGDDFLRGRGGADTCSAGRTTIRRSLATAIPPTTRARPAESRRAWRAVQRATTATARTTLLLSSST